MATNTHRFGRCRCRAVTLTEVAVTLGSVVAASSLLLPATSEMRRQSKEVQCVGNLGRIAEAATIHATTDRHEHAIPVHPLTGLGIGTVGEYEWGGKSGIGEPQVVDPSSSKWGTQQGRGPASRALNRILYGKTFPDYLDNPGANNVNWINDTRLEIDAYRCPSDYGYAGHHYAAWRDSGLTSYDHYGNSYVASGSWIGVPGGNCVLMSNSPFLRPLSRVPNPANTLLFMENPGRFAYRRNYGIDDCSSISSGPLGNDVETITNGWHGRPWTHQVAFADGHAGPVRMTGHQHPQPRIGRYPNLNGNPTTWNTWHCVIIRGLGWQIDTLPAPPVRTNIHCSSSGTVVDTLN